MIGAIIGDLAAWTWENDHEKFYPSLISEKALLSEYGLSVLATADALDYNLFMNETEYQEYIRPWFRVINYCCPIKLGKSYFPSVTCCK